MCESVFCGIEGLCLGCTGSRMLHCTALYIRAMSAAFPMKTFVLSANPILEATKQLLCRLLHETCSVSVPNCTADPFLLLVLHSFVHGSPAWVHVQCLLLAHHACVR